MKNRNNTMKTYHLKDLLKKEVLIIELPEETYYEVFKHGILFKDHLNADRGFIEGSYTLLGSPSEIREEDAEELVESWEPLDSKVWVYNNYSEGGVEFKTALESFNSALESEIYWENPLGEEEPEIIEGLGSGTLDLAYENKQWKEAQEKTFDRNRSLILFKN